MPPNVYVQSAYLSRGSIRSSFHVVCHLKFPVLMCTIGMLEISEDVYVALCKPFIMISVLPHSAI